MDRGMRVGAWLIGLSVLATILLNCLGRPHRKDLASLPALQRPETAPACVDPKAASEPASKPQCRGATSTIVR
jgi:hypothetical protein